MKKTILNAILITIFLASCAPQEIPAQVTVTAEATATVTVYEPTIPSLLTADLTPSYPAETPPEFTAGVGGEVKGISEADLNLLKAWEIYQKVYRDEAGTKTWTTKEEFAAEMLKFLSGKADLDVKVQQDADTGKVLVAVVKKAGEQSSVYWDFDNEVLANTNPMSFRAESESGLVNLPKGTSPEFRFNVQDGHWYMFAVDIKGEAVDWFATNTATKDNLDKHMVKIEKVITDTGAWMQEIKDEAVAKYGSWEAYLQKELMKDGYVRMEVASNGGDSSPTGEFYAQGLVMERSEWTEVKSPYLLGLGITKARVVPVAYEYTAGPTPVLLGVEKDGKYIQMVAYNVTGPVGDFGSYEKIWDYKDFDEKFGGDRIIFCVPSGLKIKVNGQELDLDNPRSNWFRFGKVGGAGEEAYFNLLSEEQREMMAVLVFNPDSYLRRWDNMRLPRVMPEGWESCIGWVCDVAYMVDSVDNPETPMYNPTGNGWMIAFSTGEEASSMANMSQQK